MVPDLGSQRDFFYYFSIFYFGYIRSIYLTVDSFGFFHPKVLRSLAWEKYKTPKPSTSGSRNSAGFCGLTSDVTRYLILPWTWIWSWQTWHFIIRPTEGKHTNVHIRICIFMCHFPIRVQCAVCVSLWIHLLMLKRCVVHQDSVANSLKSI